MTSPRALRMTLYHTAGCHLCEEAEALLVPCLAVRSLACLDKRDIADNPELLERYGVLIPVLRDESSGRELLWPFDTLMIKEFLSEIF